MIAAMVFLSKDDQEFHPPISPPISVSTFGSRAYLQPMDTRQYLYCLKPKKEFAEKAGIIKGVTVIGKLDIVWKTNLGERGRLQTSQLQRMVSLKNLGGFFVCCEEPFKAI